MKRITITAFAFLLVTPVLAQFYDSVRLGTADWFCIDAETGESVSGHQRWDKARESCEKWSVDNGVVPYILQPSAYLFTPTAFAQSYPGANNTDGPNDTPPNLPPVWNNTPNPTATEGVASSYSLVPGDVSDPEQDTLTITNETGCTLPVGVTIDDANDEIDFATNTSAATTTSCVFGADDGTNARVDSSAFSIVINSAASLVSPREIHPFNDLTISASDSGEIEDAGNWYTGYPLMRFIGGEHPSGYNGWSSPDGPLYAWNSFSRNNVTDAGVRAAWDSTISSTVQNQDQTITAYSGDYVVKFDSGASHTRSQVELVADGSTNKGGTYPRMLTHQQKYCTAYAWYDTESVVDGNTDLVFQHHNNTDPPNTWSGNTFDWYRNGVLTNSNFFAYGDVQTNPQFAFERRNDTHYGIVHRTIGEDWREDTSDDSIVPVNINDWIFLVFEVQFHNDVNEPLRTDSPVGGWTGIVRIWYATGTDDFTLGYEKEDIRLGWLYEDSDDGPTSHPGFYLGNNLVGYMDNFLQARMDNSGMTVSDCDPRKYKTGSAVNTPGMTYSSSGLPTGLTRNSDGTLDANGSVQTGSFTETLTVTVSGVGSDNFTRSVTVNP